MSEETVLEKCTSWTSDEKLEVIQQPLRENIRKHKERFERVAYTYWNESQNMAFWNMLRKDGQTSTQVKRAYFEKNKEDVVNKYLEFLCDLFDYKPPSSLK